MLILLAALCLGTALRAHPDVGRSSFSCRACHTRIYEEWADSTHARAFDSPVFQKKYRARGRPESCLSCHAPGAIFEAGLGRPPPARKSFREEGVGCLSCHQAGDQMVGPHRTPDAAHGTVRDAAIRSVAMCASCHAKACECTDVTPGQLHDYLHSPQRHRESCQSCHMPSIFATSVNLVRPQYPARKGRSHKIEASRDPEVLRLAMHLEAFPEGRFWHISVTNEASGHKLPGGPERSIIVETRFTDHRGLLFDHQGEWIQAKTGTRLRPAERRFYKYLLRPHYEAVETRVYYRLFDEQPRPDWILIDRVGHSFVDAPLPEGPSTLPGHPADGFPPYVSPPNLRTP